MNARTCAQIRRSADAQSIPIERVIELSPDDYVIIAPTCLFIWDVADWKAYTEQLRLARVKRKEQTNASLAMWGRNEQGDTTN